MAILMIYKFLLIGKKAKINVILGTHKHSLRTKTLEYKDDAKIFELLTRYGVRWYPVFADWSYLDQVITL